MIDVYVLDKNLDPVGVVDAYRSLIWAVRYSEIGDCEVYLPANTTTIQMLAIGRYLVRLDDDMVCRIIKIEITTDAENGNYMTVTGRDTKGFLDQRIVWGTLTSSGKAENLARKLVNSTMINPTSTGRAMRKENNELLFKLGASAGFVERVVAQISYQNVGEKVREICASYGWGYKVTEDNGQLAFSVYKGTDRRDSVIFSDAYENLASTSYKIDRSNMGNVALVAGEGEGARRSRAYYGSAAGVDRYEDYVDAKDLSREITYGELTESYPTTADGGQGYIVRYESGYHYVMHVLDVPIIGAWHLTWLQSNYPNGQIVTVDGVECYEVTETSIATFDTQTPDAETIVELEYIIYVQYLLSRGVEALEEFGEETVFEGSIIPDVTFVYKQDYFLGDIVTVENEFGISRAARIVEIIEVDDENGRRIEPKFEYIEKGVSYG